MHGQNTDGKPSLFEINTEYSSFPDLTELFIRLKERQHFITSKPYRVDCKYFDISRNKKIKMGACKKCGCKSFVWNPVSAGQKLGSGSKLKVSDFFS